jgi:hypothetical protein
MPRSLLLAGWIVFLFPLAASADDAAPAVDRALVERAAAAAERALPKARRVRMDVTSEWHRAPDGADHVDPKIPPYASDQNLVAMWGDRNRCDHLLLADGVGSYVRVFSDGLLYQVAVTENDGTVDSHAVFDATNICLHLIAQIDVPSAIGGQTSMADVIRRGTALNAEAVGSRISVLVVPPGAQQALDRMTEEHKIPRRTAWPYGVTVDTADPPRLVETWMEIPAAQVDNADGTKREIAARVDRMTVTDWQTVGHETIASVVRRVTADPGDGREIVQVVKVVEVEAILADIQPPPILAEGTRIDDRKREFHFTIGSREITFEGRSLKLKEPLYRHPGAKLDELLAEAEAR